MYIRITSVITCINVFCKFNVNYDILYNIAGGLFSGAESLKTIGQWQLFGGIINVPLDPCYHQVMILH